MRLAHLSTPEQTRRACLTRVVFLGYLVEDSEGGKEAEVVEALSCHRCSGSRKMGRLVPVIESEKVTAAIEARRAHLAQMRKDY